MPRHPEYSSVDGEPAGGLALHIVTAAIDPRMSPSDPDKFFSLANVLSLSRVPLAGVFWLTLQDQRIFPWAPLAVLGVAGVTDVLDGLFARRARRGLPQPAVSGRGAWLDPICDKIFVGLVLIALFIERSPSPLLLAMIFARELIQIPVSFAYSLTPALRHWLHYDFTATVFGKATTVCQFAAITALLFDTRAATILAVVSLVVGLLAVGDYLRRAAVIARHGSPDDRV